MTKKLKDTNEWNARGSLVQVVMLGQEFETMSGLRIMAARWHLLDGWPHDMGIEKDPEALRSYCADHITEEFSLEGISEDDVEDRYQAYIDLHEKYGDKWPVEALRDYYRCVQKRINWEERAKERVKEAREAYNAALQLVRDYPDEQPVELHELRAQAEKAAAEARKVYAPQIAKVHARMDAELLEKVCRLVGRGPMNLAA